MQGRHWLAQVLLVVTFGAVVTLPSALACAPANHGGNSPERNLACKYFLAVKNADGKWQSFRPNPEGDSEHLITLSHASRDETSNYFLFFWGFPPTGEAAYVYISSAYIQQPDIRLFRTATAQPRVDVKLRDATYEELRTAFSRFFDDPPANPSTQVQKSLSKWIQDPVLFRGKTSFELVRSLVQSGHPRPATERLYLLRSDHKLLWVPITIGRDIPRAETLRIVATDGSTGDGGEQRKFIFRLKPQILVQ